ncbi:MAG TPA: ATP-binding protein [Tepidiformaceae bacterium]
MVVGTEDSASIEELLSGNRELREQVEVLRRRVLKGEERRRALIHILGDYEQDRRRLARQKERLDSSRRALLHILQDSHESKLRLERSRKAMIHIMGDLRSTTEEVERREQELREKQEQLVQAGKLATLGELTAGIAHELNNPLNNIGLYVGNVIDGIRLGPDSLETLVHELEKAQRQVEKATEIISHLRTFGRVALIDRQTISVNGVIEAALTLIREQLRLHEVQVETDLEEPDAFVDGNWIQLEQVVVNLLTNARDAVENSPEKWIRLSSKQHDREIRITVEDSGPGIPEGMEHRIFDPFFTTKEVGKGTGLGLSITYGIVKEHAGDITVSRAEAGGACFTIALPIAEQGE